MRGTAEAGIMIRGDYWWIRPGPGGIDWAHRLAGDHVPLDTGTCAGYRDLPAPPGAALVVCIPGERVRIHTVEVPVRNRRRFLAVIPFALEDILLKDTEAYHFVALEKKRDRPDVAVAVVEHEYISNLLGELEGHGWRVRILVPDYLAIAPPESGTWLIDATEAPLLLRKPGGEGGAALGAGGDSRPPGALLLALEEAAEPPVKIQIRAGAGDQTRRIAGWETWLQARGIELEILEARRDRSAWLAGQPLPDPALNLLTGPYAAVEDTRLWVRRLLPAAGLAALLLIILAADWMLEGMRIQSTHAGLRQSMETTYREVFPDAGNLVDPRFQMEQQLQSIRDAQRSGVSGVNLLPSLEQLAGIISGRDDYILRSLSYNGNTILLEVSVPDYESLERLEDQLGGIAGVDIENAELKEGRVFSRIRLGGKA